MRLQTFFQELKNLLTQLVNASEVSQCMDAEDQEELIRRLEDAITTIRLLVHHTSQVTSTNAESIDNELLFIHQRLLSLLLCINNIHETLYSSQTQALSLGFPVRQKRLTMVLDARKWILPKSN